MKNIIFRAAAFCLLLMNTPVFAMDSYRYAHVTIDTPWAIFLFLLAIILLPIILMAILYWYFASKKPDADGGGSSE